MSTDERRRTPRYKLKIPLAIRPVGEPGAPKRRVESSDVSERGIYFVSDLPFRVGTELQIVLRMPEEVTGKSSADWNCKGRVVRIDRTPESWGMAGIGVEIQSYEASEPFRPSALNGPYCESAFGHDSP